ncbi:Protein trichome birefringence-like 6 [Striga hermonthica]|uniref:Protein trichome birefringence-like 6 n=1 Tax=Striga hermonthica TaxID=68872 RepID=A0A9N7NK32_STRHE|nr:Protein trichome birefringence-like 6 [Striga hermonthica]
MEKQTSFSVKPIRFLAFSLTISFSAVFLIFFSTWVFKPTSSSPTLLNLYFTNTSLHSNSSQYVDKNPIFTETHHGEVEFSSKSGDSAKIAEGGSEKATTVTVVNDAGNSSFTSFGDNISVDSSIVEKIGGKRDIEFEPHVAIGVKSEQNCHVTKGKWALDGSSSYPLYTNVTCPFIDEGFNCQANGRLDKEYMNWRWQPQDCDIPKFNAARMLELIRGKRLVFVGDSINRNQWESMLCLLVGAVKDPKKVYEARGRKITKERGNYCFKFEDYKCTVEFYVSHYLVHESKARIGKKRTQTLRIDTIDKGTQTLRIDTIDKGSFRWRGADFLVFNTAHWWSHSKTKAGINYYQEGDKVYPRLDVTEAFRRALLTWASWVDKYINPRKTQIFFRSSSPSHFSGGLWNSGGHCKEAFRPINMTFTSNYPEKNLIVEKIISQMKTPVTFLNITRLSDYRPDAHPSIYGRKSVKPSIQDCSHWCLPGVPDIWNELLYYHLQSSTKANFIKL